MGCSVATLKHLRLHIGRSLCQDRAATYVLFCKLSGVNLCTLFGVDWGACQLWAICPPASRDLAMRRYRLPNEPFLPEVIAVLIRMTGGNFRLLTRILTHVERVLEANRLLSISTQVIEAARDSLVIGPAYTNLRFSTPNKVQRLGQIICQATDRGRTAAAEEHSPSSSSASRRFSQLPRRVPCWRTLGTSVIEAAALLFLSPIVRS